MMNPDQLRRFRKSLGLTQAAFAKVVHVTPNTIARWERNELKMRASTALLLKMLRRQHRTTAKGGR